MPATQSKRDKAQSKETDRSESENDRLYAMERKSREKEETVRRGMNYTKKCIPLTAAPPERTRPRWVESAIQQDEMGPVSWPYGNSQHGRRAFKASLFRNPRTKGDGESAGKEGSAEGRCGAEGFMKHFSPEIEWD